KIVSAQFDARFAALVSRHLAHDWHRDWLVRIQLLLERRDFVFGSFELRGIGRCVFDLLLVGGSFLQFLFGGRSFLDLLLGGGKLVLQLSALLLLFFGRKVEHWSFVLPIGILCVVQESEHLKVFPLRERIVLVIVALSAAH